MKKSTYKIALYGMLFAVAAALQYLETLIPVSAFMPPGAKPGFSNIVTMLAASAMGFGSAITVTLVKALFAGVTRGVTAFFMSLCGGVLSTVVMCVMFKLSKKASYILIGVVSAIMHNAGQLAVAIISAGSVSVLGYAPMLLVSGIVTGAITGAISAAAIPKISKTIINIRGGK